MAYDISLSLPKEWISFSENFDDESGFEISHLEAQLTGKDSSQESLIDVYVGDLPDGETAEDQAFANYAETVGFDDEDETAPIVKFTFNNKNAWGFDALTEDESPMKFISQEVRKGVLAIIIVCGKDEETLKNALLLAERGLRIK